MIPIIRWRSAVLAMFALTLGACADGGGETGTGVGPGNIPIETLHTGVITGFGSIFVNGIEFGTRSSRFVLDGTHGTEHDLAVGMIVSVRGSVNTNRVTGTASRVQYTSEVNGIVLAATISAVSEKGTLNVMGRTVMVDENTVFDSTVDTITSIAQVPAGSIVEVSGHSSSSSDIHATRVGLKSATYDGREIEVKGVITNIMDDSFDLGTLHVSYPLASTLASGWYVEVRSTHGVINNELVATTVTKIAESGDKPMDGIAGELWTGQGVVTSALANNAFVLNGVTVVVSGATRYLGGTSADILLNRRINVEGEFVEVGMVGATVIEIVPVAEFGMEALVQNVDPEASILGVIGTPVHADAETIFKDDRDRVRSFGVANIAAGDRLDVQLARMPDGSLLATKVVRSKPSTEPEELSGPFMSANGQHSVAGIPVTFSTCNPKCKPPPDGTRVELEGIWTGTVFNVESFAPEDD